MGLYIKIFFDNHSEGVLACKCCKTHLTTFEKLVSKAFQGVHGRAWLFSNVANVDEGEVHERVMTTGKHEIRDIFCRQCGEQIGWKYEKAYENDQKYKEGKFILERALVREILT